jgi:hypothetical protein
MQRSKRQAVAFLLGAVLVGGVIGFSADRVVGRFKSKENTRATWFDRAAMYEDLGFTTKQIEQWEAMSDTTACMLEQISVQMAPMRAQYDSVRRQRRRQLMEVLTAEQLATFEARQQQYGSPQPGRGQGGGRDGRGASPPGNKRGDTKSAGTQQRSPGMSRAERAEACKALLKEQPK